MINPTFKVSATVSEIAEHIYTVNAEIIITVDGDDYRFINVGTKLWHHAGFAESARVAKIDLLHTQLNEEWLDLTLLVRGFDNWKCVPNMECIHGRNAADIKVNLREGKEAFALETTEPVKPFDSFWDKIRDLQHNLAFTHRENGGKEHEGSIIVYVGRDNRFHYFHKVGETKMRIAEVTWEKLAHEGCRINVPASSVSKLFAHLSRNGILLSDNERRAARAKLEI